MPGAWAILLAAGESTRMGQLKALLPWRGQTLVEHQTAALLEGGAEQRNVAGELDHGSTGLTALDSNAVQDILLLNVDQPRSGADVARILRAHRRHSRESGNPYAVTVPEYNGKGGHPIVLSAGLLPELREIDEESQGIKAVVRRRPDSVYRIPLDNPEILLDLNTPEQYRAAVEAAGV